MLLALRNGDKDDKELRGILSCLDRAREELVERILVAQVGMIGNLRDGFRIRLWRLHRNQRKRKAGTPKKSGPHGSDRIQRSAASRY